MAIKIDIPGIGEVSVEGMAQEDTMQQILAAVNKSEKAKKRDEDELVKSKEKETKATKKATSALEDLIEEEEKAAADTVKRKDEFNAGMRKATTETAKNLGSFASSLAATATTVAVSMVKNIDENAANPIKFGAQVINTGIDLLGSALKIGVDAISSFAQAGLSLGGPFLQGAQNAVKATAEVSKAAIELGASVAKAGNEFMAAEFDKTVKSMKQLTTAGASFSNGLLGLREAANLSGIGLSAFSNIVAKAAPNLQAIGITATESTGLMSRGMEGLAKQVKGTNGQLTTTRNQLLALGFSYEEQGEVMSLYMQQQAIAGKNLKNIAPEELAAGTKEYAKNLKIISDFTGKDAKKIQERAQIETLRAGIKGKLDAKQLESFNAFYAATEKLDPAAAAKKQLDMLQRIMTDGAASNVIAIQANTDLAEAAGKDYQAVIKGTGTLETFVGNFAEVAKKSENSLAESTGRAQLFRVGGGGPADEIATMITAVNVAYGQASEEQIKQIRKTAEDQSTTNDAVTAGFAKATDALTKFQNKTETLATDLMPKYAGAIEKSIEAITKVATVGMDYAAGNITAQSVVDAFNGPDSEKKESSPAEEIVRPKTDADNLKSLMNLGVNADNLLADQVSRAKLIEQQDKENLKKAKIDEKVLMLPAMAIENLGDALGDIVSSIGIEGVGKRIKGVAALAKEDRVASAAQFLKDAGRQEIKPTFPQADKAPTYPKKGDKPTFPQAQEIAKPIKKAKPETKQQTQTGNIKKINDASAEKQKANIDTTNVASAKLAEKTGSALDALREIKGARVSGDTITGQVATNTDRQQILDQRIKPIDKPGQLDDLRKELEIKIKNAKDKDLDRQTTMKNTVRDEKPNDIITKQLNNILQEHTSILNRIADGMQQNNRYASGLLQNSY